MAKTQGDRCAEIKKSLLRLPDDMVSDGEIVALDPEGRTSFSLLQNSRGRDHTITFYAFDLVLRAGEDMKGFAARSSPRNC